MRCRVGHGRCSERLGGAEVYLPVLEALDNLLSSGGLHIAEQMNAIAPAWGYGQVTGATSFELDRPVAPSHAISQEQLKREMTALLRELSRAQPIVLFFDDVHWADTSTVDIVDLPGSTLRRAARVGRRHLSPVGTVACEACVPGPAAEPAGATPLPRVLPSTCSPFRMWRRTSVLSSRATTSAAALPGRVHSKTEGNPLFMAVSRSLPGLRIIAQDSQGRWTLRGVLAAIGAELPKSVRAMIERKIAQLSDDERTLLTARASEGYEFDCVGARSVLARDAGEIKERLEALERLHHFVTLVDERELSQTGDTYVALSLRSRAVSERAVRDSCGRLVAWL